MTEMRMKVTLIMAIVSIALCNKAEVILRKKIKSMTSDCPSGAGLHTNTQKLAKNYLISITTPMLDKYISKKDNIAYRRNGHSQDFAYKPYGNFASLKYGEKYESLEEDIDIVSGGVSYFTTRAYTGYRKGYNVEIASVLAVASSNAIQKYRGRKCIKYTGIKQARKCVQWQNTDPRAMTLAEIKTVEGSLRCLANKEAMNKMPSSLSGAFGFEAADAQIDDLEETQEIEVGLLGATRKRKFKQSLTNVEKKDVFNAIKNMVRGNIDTWKSKISGIVNANKSGNVSINKNGKWAVEIKKTGTKFNVVMKK